MDWKDIVKKAAPVVGSLIPGGGPVLSLVASALGTDENVDSIARAIEKDPKAAAKLKELELTHKNELQKLLIEERMGAQLEVNKTIRAELAADDKYKSYWRPTFGYVAAAAWFIQTLAIVALVVYSIFCEDPVMVAKLYEGATTMIAALTTQWGILLSVLGISVHQRSKDKQVSAGQEPKGLLSIFSK